MPQQFSVFCKIAPEQYVGTSAQSCGCLIRVLAVHYGSEVVSLKLGVANKFGSFLFFFIKVCIYKVLKLFILLKRGIKYYRNAQISTGQLIQITLLY